MNAATACLKRNFLLLDNGPKGRWKRPFEPNQQRLWRSDMATPITTGVRFARLVVIRRVEPKSGKSQYLCRCDCGTEKIIRAESLIKGKTQSCGCLGRERRAASNTKHGGHKEPLYRVWEGMKERCSNPASAKYHIYGGSGISVCDEWREYSVFRTWAVEHGYKKGLTLDRIDGGNGYSPNNCRWATYAQQNRNKRDNRLVEWGGRKILVRDLAIENGLHPNTLAYRLDTGMDLQAALTKPVVYRSGR